jgi:hypothetical protein
MPACPRYAKAALLGAALALAAGLPGGAPAGGIPEGTQLLAVATGTVRSQSARALGRGGYDLADGGRVDLRPWYTGAWQDLRVDLVTALDPGLGVVWGFTTGEGGPKYRIDPGLRIGLVAFFETGRDQSLAIGATTVIGGALRELPCIADFGEIGGVVAVNCRLAATEMPPEDTLDYLLRMGGRSEFRAWLRFEWRF